MAQTGLEQIPKFLNKEDFKKYPDGVGFFGKFAGKVVAQLSHISLTYITAYLSAIII